MTPNGFDEDRYAPADSTDLLPLLTFCVECARDRVAPDYPLCTVHAPKRHYTNRQDCLCTKCNPEPCCEEKSWGNPCNCAAEALTAAA